MSTKKPNSNKRIIQGASVTGFFALVGRKLCSIVKFDRVNGKDDPDATLKRVNNMKRAAFMIGLLILVLIIIILLLHGCQGREAPHGSVDIPGNVIDPMLPAATPKADLEFNDANAEENLSFEEKGMDGGHSKCILYRIIATYNSDFILKYDMSVRENEEFQKLAEILKIKVELVGTEGTTLLYDGLLSDMEELALALKADTDTKTEYLFRITTYLDDFLDEEYYGQKLIADMYWWIEGQDRIAIANNEFTTVSKAAPPVIVPDLRFITINEGDNTAFHMKNIKNGDSQTRYFAFEVIHGEDVQIDVRNTVVADSKLGDVLKVKVELIGEDGSVTLYEGSLRDLHIAHALPKNDRNKSTVYYKITVTADGLTEDYCGTKLVCDFSWTLDGTSEQLKVPSNRFEAYDKPYAPPTPPNPPRPPETATSIELTAKDGYDNIPFIAENMLPGDSVVQYYCVSVTHDSTEAIRFHIQTDTAQKLSRVLRVKVELLLPDAKDQVLYDGLMKDCTATVTAAASTETVTPLYYRITVYTNGAEVGNEYAGAGLTADFSWQLQ